MSINKIIKGIVCVAFSLAFFVPVFAQEQYTPNVRVKNIVLDKNVYASGEKIAGSFLLSNMKSVAVSDLYYEISLVGDYGENTLAQKFYDATKVGPIYLQANEIKNIDFEYVLPVGVAGEGLGIQIGAMLGTGFRMGWGDAFIKVEGTNDYLNVNEAYISIGENNFGVQIGPVVYPNEDVFINVKVSNSNAFTVDLKPVVKIYDRANPDVVISEEKVPGVLVSPKSASTVKYKLPKFDNKNGVYLGIVEFSNGARKQAADLEFRYIIGNDIVTVKGLTADRTVISKGDNINLDLYYSGSVFDVRNPDQKFDANYDLEILLKSNEGVLVAEYRDRVDFNKGNILGLTVKAINKADSINSEVKITKEGVLISEYKSVLPKIVSTSSSKFNLVGIVLVVLLTIVILAVIFLILKKKASAKNISAGLMIIVLLFIGYIVHAGFESTGSGRSGVGDSPTLPSLYVQSPDSDEVYDPGESFNLTGTITADNCENQYLYSKILYKHNQGSSFGSAQMFPVPGDYDGDGKNDFALWDPVDGKWYIKKSDKTTNIVNGWPFGGSTMIPAPGDYDGDGKDDIALWNKTDGKWYAAKAEGVHTAIFYGYEFGGSTMVPVPGDYDGDGKDDFALWNPVDGKWYIKKADKSANILYGHQFGGSTMIPVPGDYDGDNKDDLALWNPVDGKWYIQKADKSANIVYGYSFGGPIMKMAPGDYDGDGKNDIVFWNPSNGKWNIQRADNFADILRYYAFGNLNMYTVPGDYDGDGKDDLALWDKTDGKWYIAKAASPNQAIVYGWVFGAKIDNWTDGQSILNTSNYENGGSNVTRTSQFSIPLLAPTVGGEYSLGVRGEAYAYWSGNIKEDESSYREGYVPYKVKTEEPVVYASCSVDPMSTTTGQIVTWTASTTNLSAPISYSWTGDEFVQGKVTPIVSGTYATSNPAIKSGSVTITNGVKTLVVACPGTVVATSSNGTIPAFPSGSCTVNCTPCLVNCGPTITEARVDGICPTGLIFPNKPSINTLQCLSPIQPTGTVGGGVDGPWNWVCEGSGPSHNDDICEAEKQNPVDENLTCSLTRTVPTTTNILVNQNSTWVALANNCPSCSEVRWSVDGKIIEDDLSLNYLFTTVGLKTVQAELASSTEGVWGRACVATSTVAQEGGGVDEI